MPKLAWEFGIVGGFTVFACVCNSVAHRMGNANAAPAAPSSAPAAAAPAAPLANSTNAQDLSWDELANKALREGFGISAAGGIYFTGLDVLTLPTAYVAGHILGLGIGVWRGQANFGRAARGMGSMLVGLTLVCPPPVRIMYSPWILLSPGAAAWAGLTAGIVGVGKHLVDRPCAENEHEQALVIEIPDVPVTVANKFFGAALVGIGVYLAAPGALRVMMMFGSK
eukprot:COSAG02_NODE_7523_length_2974_cov_7.116870_2_plen_225_part_00